jgi:hypothetical protein
MAYEYMGGFSNPTSMGEFRGSTIGALPTVADPEKAYADMSRADYMNFLRNYSGFEDELIRQAQNDTSLIDTARDDSAKAAGLASGIAGRNVSRFGGQLTPAQQQQQQAGLQRSNTLGSIQALGDARIAQREANQRLLSDLINIGQGVARSSQAGLSNAAGLANQREQAYNNAKAQSKAQTYSTIGGLGAAAIIALAI